MTTFSLHHVHIVCNDWEAMEAFWIEALGAKLVARRSFGTALGATMDLDGVLVYVKGPAQGQAYAETPAAKSPGYDHVALAVDDIHAAVERLKSHGCESVTPPTDKGNRFACFMKGPEDLSLELIQFKEQGA